MAEFFTSHSFIIAQVLGFIAMAVQISSFQFKKHKVIMTMQVISGCFWCLHYLTLGVYTGLVINIIHTIRNYVYGLREKKNLNSKIIPAIFLVFTVDSSIYTWENWWSLLAMTASMFSTVANWQKNTNKLKLLSLPREVLWITYDIANKSIAGACSDAFAMASIFISFIRIHFENKKGENANASIQ